MHFRHLLCPLALSALATPSLAGGAPAIDATRVASGLVRPVYVTHAPGDFERIFIVEKRGVILVMDLATGVRQTFLDINSQVGGGLSNNDERGLLGLAFDPDYQSNGFFYVDYTDNASDTVVSRWEVLGDPATSNVADSTSESILLAIDQPQGNHNGGWIGFGPNDGYLYVAMGDGGNACDQGTGHTADIGNAQDLTDNLLGKILRIDVDGGPPYGIPPTNPFVGEDGDDEIWAYGLRNPYRCSFDRATGDFYIGDVGQALAEEVDYQLASSTGGENYGWKCMEGNECSTDSPSNCNAMTGCNCPSPTPGLTGPIHDYTHNPPPAPAGFVCSVIGGYVYRGDCIPDLHGTYFFTDFCGSPAFWSFEVDGGAVTNFQSRPELSVSLESISVNQVVSFGEDARGEIYIVDQGSGTSGNVFKIVPVAQTTSRNEAPNPASYVASTGVLGGTILATVDNALAGQTSSVLIAFDSPASVTLSTGQVLLCIDTGSGELFTGGGLAPTSMVGSLDLYEHEVANDPAICGITICSQAIQFGNPPFTLSNAQDFLLGF